MTSETKKVITKLEEEGGNFHSLIDMISTRM
jgi:hypothetical protein